MTAQEAAAILEVKPGTVYALCSAGLLAHRRVGLGRGLIRIDQADLDTYIAGSRVECRKPAPATASARTGLAVPSPIGMARAERERRRAARAEKDHKAGRAT